MEAQDTYAWQTFPRVFITSVIENWGLREDCFYTHKMDFNPFKPNTLYSFNRNIPACKFFVHEVAEAGYSTQLTGRY